MYLVIILFKIQDKIITYFFLNRLAASPDIPLSLTLYTKKQSSNYTLLPIFQERLLEVNYQCVSVSLRCTEVLLNLHSHSLLVYKQIVIRSNILLFFIETNHTVPGKQVRYTLVGALPMAERQLRASKSCNIFTCLVGFCS